MIVLAALHNQYRDTGRTDHATTQEHQETEQIVPFAAPPEGQHTEPEAGRNEWRAERDLEAQQEMARWAFWLWAATIVGIGLLAATLWETRKAAQAAYEMVGEAKATTAATNASAVETRKSNEIARIAYMAEQRPWLRWEIAQPISVKRHGDSLRVTISATLENFGKTPARNVLYFAELYSPAPHEAAANRGLRFHAKHLEEYRCAMFFMADILPNEKIPIEFGPILRIEDLLHGPHKQFTLCLSFHTAYASSRAWEWEKLGRYICSWANRKR